MGKPELTMLGASSLKALLPRLWLLTSGPTRSRWLQFQQKRFKSSAEKFSFCIRNEAFSGRKAIKNYVEIGKMVQKSPSNFHQDLDELIAKHDESRIILKAWGQGQIPDNASLNRFFIALVAPSFTGKTQAAFSIRSKLPLYFVFSSIQDIYRPFVELSEHLRLDGKADVEVIKKYLVRNYHWPPNSEDSFNISLDDLAGLDIKLKSLGLLCALFKEAHSFESNPNNKRDDWFHHLASNREISYQAMSFNEYFNEAAQNQYVKKYCVFLDEFKGSQEIVFLRNLCRFLTLTCIVSSTNSKVANLIGKSPMTSSRGAGEGAWSVVFDSLGPFTPQSLESNVEYQEAISSFIESVSKISEKEGARMKLLGKYLEDQCLSSRPGIAHLIMTAVYELKNEDVEGSESLLVDDLFEKMLVILLRELESRKPQAFLEDKSKIACSRIVNGGHFKNCYYKTEEDKDSAGLIDEHFFYLCNPNKPPEGPILLTKRWSERKVRLFISKSQAFNIKSYFNPKEELLLMTCLFRGLNAPAHSVVDPEYYVTHQLDVQNPEAIKRSRQNLENLVARSIIHASHNGTLRGIEFGPFLRRLVRNFNPHGTTRINTRLCINPAIMRSFEKLKVPFFFPKNMAVPEPLKQIFPVNESRIKLGNYFRTAGADGIDTVFDLVNVKQESTGLVKAVVEAKNLASNLTGTDLVRNLKNFFAYAKMAKNAETKFPIHFTFCSTLSNFEGLGEKSAETLKTLAVSKKINFLRLAPLNKNSPEDFVVLEEDGKEITSLEQEQGQEQEQRDAPTASFELAPWSKNELPLHVKPKLTVILAETDFIVNEFKK